MFPRSFAHLFMPFCQQMGWEIAFIRLYLPASWNRPLKYEFFTFHFSFLIYFRPFESLRASKIGFYEWKNDL